MQVLYGFLIFVVSMTMDKDNSKPEIVSKILSIRKTVNLK